jgi:hypothetical protein
VRSNRAFALVVLTAVLSLGPICDGSATQEDACFNLCDCLYFLPNDVDACTSECITDVAPGLTQECIDCVAAAECIDLESGRACQDECSLDSINRLTGDQQ